MKCEISEIIKLKIGDTRVEVTRGQAAALRDVLNEFLGSGEVPGGKTCNALEALRKIIDEHKRENTSMTVHVYPGWLAPYWLYYPPYERPYYYGPPITWTTTIGSSASMGEEKMS